MTASFNKLPKPTKWGALYVPRELGNGAWIDDLHWGPLRTMHSLPEQYVMECMRTECRNNKPHPSAHAFPIVYLFKFGQVLPYETTVEKQERIKTEKVDHETFDS